jgi:hypothetical protein
VVLIAARRGLSSFSPCPPLDDRGSCTERRRRVAVDLSVD